MAWQKLITKDDAGVADGVATLDGAALVVQDPANATVVPTASKIPKALVDGKLDIGWLPTDVAGGIASLDGTKRAVAEGLVVAGNQVVAGQQAAVADPAGGATIDVECRATVLAILARLRVHGLIAP